MVRTIVVPLDRSVVAESALPFAISLARETGSRMSLLAVIDLPLEFAAWLDATTIIDKRIDVEDAYEDYLETLASEIDDVPVEIAVRSGGAVSEIQRHVEALEDPVVVMASHGRSGVSRLLIGSVTQQVVHRLKTPVIVVPARAAEGQVNQSAQINSVLFPLDGSPFAEFALEAGLGLLGEHKPDVHLLRVVEVVSWHGGPYSAMDYYGLDPYIDVSKNAALDYLNKVAEQLTGRGYNVTLEVRVGLVADQIEAVAESRDVDLVIMATHGRTGVGRLIFGSVAERTLRQSPAPLLLVHPGPGVSDVPPDQAHIVIPAKD